VLAYDPYVNDGDGKDSPFTLALARHLTTEHAKRISEASLAI
jgi:hypothetical protein